jgi:ubiquitin-like protein ATG12
MDFYSPLKDGCTMTEEAETATPVESETPLSDEVKKDDTMIETELMVPLNDEFEKEAAPIKTEFTNAPKPNGNNKVKVHFVAVGSAPIMKKTKFQLGADQRFAAVTMFLRKMLKMAGTGSSLFLYCNSSFVPSPDELVGDLNDCFSVRGELVIHYSFQEAWG